MRKPNRREPFLPRKVRQAFSNGIVYLLLLAGSGFMLFPLFWMISTSLKTMEEANSPRITWWPAQPQPDAYRQVLTDSRWLLYFSNSISPTPRSSPRWRFWGRWSRWRPSPTPSAASSGRDATSSSS